MHELRRRRDEQRHDTVLPSVCVGKTVLPEATAIKRSGAGERAGQPG
jgi:hypothetical protein